MRKLIAAGAVAISLGACGGTAQSHLSSSTVSDATMSSIVSKVQSAAQSSPQFQGNVAAISSIDSTSHVYQYDTPFEGAFMGACEADGSQSVGVCGCILTQAENQVSMETASQSLEAMNNGRGIPQWLSDAQTGCTN